MAWPVGERRHVVGAGDQQRRSACATSATATRCMKAKSICSPQSTPEPAQQLPSDCGAATAANTAFGLPPVVCLLDRVHLRVRYLNHRIRTEEAYVYWVRTFVRLESRPGPWRGPLFAEKRMAARQVVNAAASGKCSFPRAGGRLGWGSNAGTAPARFRPPPQPSPCPGAGAITSVARTFGVRRIFTMRNDLFV